MRVIAAILGMIMMGLFIQPALFPVHAKKVMACCMKKDKQHKGSPRQGHDCCNDDQCNPFFSQCPICAANAVVTGRYTIPVPARMCFVQQKYFLTDDDDLASYRADILRPPQVV